MAGLVHNLIDILEDELNNYNELLKISYDKTSVIIRGDTQQLKSIMSKEEELVAINKSVEKNRIEIMSDIAMVLNKDKDTLTLSSLIGFLDTQQEEQARLGDIKSELKRVLDNLKSVNEQNGILIKQTLDYLDYNINAAISLQSLPPISYHNDGLEAGFEGRNFFDKKQ